MYSTYKTLTDEEKDRVEDLLEELADIDKDRKELDRKLKHLQEEIKENSVERRFAVRSLSRYGVDVE